MIIRIRVQRRSDHAVATVEDATSGEPQISIVCFGSSAADEAARVATAWAKERGLIVGRANAA